MLFVSSRSGIIFNPNVGAITDHNQSVIDIDPYLKSQLYVEDPATERRYSFLPNGLSKPEERAQDRNLVSAVDGIQTHNLLIDSLACYHRPITALVGGTILVIAKYKCSGIKLRIRARVTALVLSWEYERASRLWCKARDNPPDMALHIRTSIYCCVR